MHLQYNIMSLYQELEERSLEEIQIMVTYLKMTTASDKCAGTNHHETDEDLQHNPSDRGSTLNPSDTGTCGEKVFPHPISSFSL